LFVFYFSFFIVHFSISETITCLGEKVTIVKRARLVAADGKLSLVVGIPIVFPDIHVSIRTEPAAKKSSSTSGNPFYMICFVLNVFFCEFCIAMVVLF
jgi:hypothetical protein